MLTRCVVRKCILTLWAAMRLLTTCTSNLGGEREVGLFQGVFLIV